jgi:hypothetical protein
LYKQSETTPIVQDFEAVKPEIQRELYEKKLQVAMQKKMDSLLKAAHVENFLEGSIQMARSVVPASAQGPSPQSLK